MPTKPDISIRNWTIPVKNKLPEFLKFRVHIDPSLCLVTWRLIPKHCIGPPNQKRALGLINCGKDLTAFSDAPPMILLVLVNYDPDSTRLMTCLESIDPIENAEITHT